LPVVASAWGRKDVLEWALAREGGMRPDARTTAEAVDEASRHGQVDMLDFWLNSGLPLHYSEAALSSATIKRQVPTLECWKKSGLKLRIGNVLDFASMEGSDEVLVIATRYARVEALEWWAQSGLAVEFRFFDIEEALEDCLAAEGEKEKTLAWWEARGYDTIMGANAWMRMRGLRENMAQAERQDGKPLPGFTR
ncbi:hypothetical protein JCM11641_000411, partial [Rhodosporidiobolus odoratus]